MFVVQWAWRAVLCELQKTCPTSTRYNSTDDGGSTGCEGVDSEEVGQEEEKEAKDSSFNR